MNSEEENTDNVLSYQNLSYIPKITDRELIRRHSDNLFVGYFGI